jgi:hypothetical protein
MFAGQGPAFSGGRPSNGCTVVYGDITQAMESKHRMRRQFHREFELATDRLDVAAQRREIHIRPLFDLRHGRLFDVECRSDVFLRFSGDLAKLAQALDLLPEVPVASRWRPARSQEARL